jgi:parafibromin
MKQTRENGLTVGFVSVTERKKVVDVLEGRVPDHDGAIPAAEGGNPLFFPLLILALILFGIVESTTPPGSPPRDLGSRSAVIPKSSTAEPTSSPTKRRYVPDHHDAEVVKKIKHSEVELRDRNTVLRGNKPNVRLLLQYLSLVDWSFRTLLPYELLMQIN